MIEGLAFGEGRNDNTEESDDEEPAYKLQADFIRALPYMACKTFKEFRDGEFSNP